MPPSAAVGARTVAVLGEMRELGESAGEEHEAVGRLAVRLDIHQLLVVGEAASRSTQELSRGLRGYESVFVGDHDAAVDWLDASSSPATSSCSRPRTPYS